jgi:hypothetical protein
MTVRNQEGMLQMFNYTDLDYHVVEAHRRRLYEDARPRSIRGKRNSNPYRAGRHNRR